jgi:hypothetical protein
MSSFARNSVRATAAAAGIAAIGLGIAAPAMAAPTMPSVPQSPSQGAAQVPSATSAATRAATTPAVAATPARPSLPGLGSLPAVPALPSLPGVGSLPAVGALPGVGAIGGVTQAVQSAQNTLAALPGAFQFALPQALANPTAIVSSASVAPVTLPTGMLAGGVLDKAMAVNPASLAPVAGVGSVPTVAQLTGLAANAAQTAKGLTSGNTLGVGTSALGALGGGLLR